MSLQLIATVTLVGHTIFKLTRIIPDLMDTKSIGKVIPTPMLQV